jgi:Ni,Fe-hydrogenase III large subunit
MTASAKKNMSKSLKKVLVVLQDRDAAGRVYIKMDEPLPSNEILLEAIKRLEEGTIYKDADCKLLNDDEYIEIYHERGTPKKNEDFVFLIHRSFAHEHIAAMQIMQ